jgi:nicotinate dehydrogenase subunit A
MARLVLNVNGAEHRIDVRDAAEPLLFVLRNQLRLTGAKYGCGLGQCGACTVLIDGEAARSCLVPATGAQGKAIVTVEGLGTEAKPHTVRWRSSSSRRRNAATARAAW